MDIDVLITRLVDLNDELADRTTRYAGDGRVEEAAAIELRRRRLSAEIDKLSGLSHQQWSEAAATVQGKIEQHNRQMENKLRRVERSLKTIRNFARFLEHLDQLIKLAAAVVN